MIDSTSARAVRIVVAGGGIAAAETLLALRSLVTRGPNEPALQLTLLAPNDQLHYRPLSVTEPFGRPAMRRYSLAGICADLGATLLPGAVRVVDGAQRAIVTERGERIDYDVLVIATGARSGPALPRAHTFLAEDADSFHWIVRELEQGVARRVAFVVPAGNGWSLPLYELALMTAGRVHDMGLDDVALTLVTPEHVPLAVFGGAASDAVARLLAEAGIALVADVYAHDYDGRALVLTPGASTLAADRVIALPRLSGPAIEGVPCDPDGFVHADEHGRVPGLDDVYAIGDATTFPIKQGGVATQQADRVAALIAAAAGADVSEPSTRPMLRAILLTGTEPLYLRATITGGESVASTASHRALWWPPHKIAARYLASYLADRDEAGPAAAREHAVTARLAGEPACVHPDAGRDGVELLGRGRPGA